MTKSLYPDQDINDLIEEDQDAFFKGGVGSGRKGHVTAGAFRQASKDLRDAEADSDPVGIERHTKAKAEARKEVIRQLTPAEKDQRIKDNDAKLEALKNVK